MHTSDFDDEVHDESTYCHCNIFIIGYGLSSTYCSISGLAWWRLEMSDIANFMAMYSENVC